MTYLSMSELMAGEKAIPAAPPRKPLVVKPVLTYDTPSPQKQTSWRTWGGIQTQQDAEAEAAHPRRTRQAVRGRRLSHDDPALGHGTQRRGACPGQGGDRLGGRGRALRGRRRRGGLRPTSSARLPRTRSSSAAISPARCIAGTRPSARPIFATTATCSRQKATTTRTWSSTARTSCCGGSAPWAA